MNTCLLTRIYIVSKFIVIKTENKYKKVFIDDVLYCKADGAYTKFYFKDKKEFLCARLLKEVEKELKHFNFFRINRTYLANLNHCCEIHKNGNVEIEFLTGKKLPVSRSKCKELVERFYVYS